MLQAQALWPRNVGACWLARTEGIPVRCDASDGEFPGPLRWGMPLEADAIASMK
jgi:hypothetical protein